MARSKPPKTDIKYEKSCGVIAFRRTASGFEFLLLKYPEGHWDFPKGHVEGEETEIETALRELAEETGIEEVNIVDGYKDGLTYEFYANFPNLKGWICKTVVYFLGEVVREGDIIISDEHHGSIWLPLKDARAHITYDNMRAVFDRAVEYLTSFGK